MSSSGYSETDQPQPGIDFLRSELAALQESPDELATPSGEITMAIIRWCLGEKPTLGDRWAKAHQMANVGRWGYDVTELSIQNDAARLMAFGLTEAGDITRANRLIDQFYLSTMHESASRKAYTYYLTATVAANSGELETEVRDRRTANRIWEDAALAGEEFSEEDLVLRFINISALAACERRLSSSSQLKRKTNVDTGGLL